MAVKNKHPSQAADRIILRFDDKEMKPMIKQRAVKNRRPMNSEILHPIEAGLAVETTKENAPEDRSSEALISKTPISIKESDND